MALDGSEACVYLFRDLQQWLQELKEQCYERSSHVHWEESRREVILKRHLNSIYSSK